MAIDQPQPGSRARPLTGSGRPASPGTRRAVPRGMLMACLPALLVAVGCQGGPARDVQTPGANTPAARDATREGAGLEAAGPAPSADPPVDTPPRDLELARRDWPIPLEVATFGVPSFQEAETLFGSLPGVVRTAAGYAGGASPNPNYENRADHRQAVRVEYDPLEISFDELLAHAFVAYDPLTGRHPEGLAILFENETQAEIARSCFSQLEELLGTAPPTPVVPVGHFSLAEEEHQKQELRQAAPSAHAELRRIYPDLTEFVASPTACQINAYLAHPLDDLSSIRQESADWGLSDATRRLVLQVIAERHFARPGAGRAGD